MALTRPKYSQIYDSDFKNSARVATTTTITLAGGAPTVVDGVTLAEGDRVLVRVQNTASQNGIYRVNVLGTGNNGTWGRTLDADTATKLGPGTTLTVEEGSTLAGKLYRMTSTNPITLGSTPITWTDVSGGGGSAGGNNGQIQYNDTNAFGGATYLWYNETTGTITANAGVESTSTTTGTFITTGGVGISGALNVGANVTVAGNVLPSANVTYNLGSPSQRWKDLYLSGTTINLNGATISATSGAITFQNSLGGSFSVTGESSGQSTGTFGNLVANSGIASTSTSTGALVITGGAGISGALNVGGDIVASGNLTINGTTTNINTTNLVVEDKNIIIADVATPSDTTADGAGITVKGTTDKTFTWIDVTDAWTSSEDLNLLTGKQYKINGTSVLTATTLGSGVVNSSLTSVGTITSLAATTGVVTNFSSSNVYISGGYISALTNATVTTSTISNAAITTGNIANFSTANAVITGGSLSNVTIGSATHTTGRFTTIIATSVSAGTIGNSGAVLTGTLSTASQTNITDLGNLTSLSVAGTSTRGGKALITNFTANVPPASPQQGDEWYKADTDILYKYIYDGTNYQWVDLTSPLYNANVSAIANTLALRDSSGNLTATNFIGVASSARYADLAENYTADSSYSPGTVVVFGGENEITVTQKSHDTSVAGVISTNPAYLMNSACEGLPVAFTGRVPCLVKGPVAKGQLLVTSETPGVAMALNETFYKPGCVLGKSLENITTSETATIEVVVGRF